MNEIKFRAKATEDYQTALDGIQEGDWVYGYYFFCKRRMSGIIITTMEVADVGVGSGLAQVEIKVDSKTVGQYANLKDEDKKEIYGGHIINIVYTGTKMSAMNSEVFFERGCFRIWSSSKLKVPLGSMMRSAAKVTIIGNIHDDGGE